LYQLNMPMELNVPMEVSAVDEPATKVAKLQDGDTASKGKGDGKGKKKGKEKGPVHHLVLESVRHEYDEVYSYQFSSADNKNIEYKAGQWGHLVAPGGEGGKGGVRHMSFASTAEDGHYLFSMDLSSKSDYKELFRAAKPGDKTAVFKIKGEFVIDAAEQDNVVFVAGGIGITPMRALIRDLVSRNLPVKWSLVHIARSGHLYSAELEKHCGVQQVRTNRAGAADALSASVAANPQAWYYVCGSQRFVEGITESLQTLGVSAEKVRTENFK